MSEANPLKTSIIEQARQEGQLKLDAAKKQIQKISKTARRSCRQKKQMSAKVS